MTPDELFPVELRTKNFDWLIVHCSATSPLLDVDAEWVDRVHRRRGFARCGYHAVIKRDGTIEMHHLGQRTRPLTMSGAHVGGCGPGWNDCCLGVCLIGGVKADGRTPDDNFTQEQMTSLARFIFAAMDAYTIPPQYVKGHRDLIKITNAAPKACPCFSVTEFLQQVAMEITDREPPTIMDAAFDALRLMFNWNRAARPAPQRGEKLVVPRTHKVKPGETLWSISRVTGVPVHALKELNELEGDIIQVGQKLRLLN